MYCSYNISLERRDAFDAICEERDYQDARRGNARREKIEDNRDLGSLILLTQTYLRKAEEAFAGPHPEGKTAALDQLRKVAALVVLAMEVHGTVLRKEANARTTPDVPWGPKE